MPPYTNSLQHVRYKGITFTDKDGNIIRDGDDEDDATGNSSDEPRDYSEITGVDEGENETSRTTGVPQINPEGNSHDPEGNSHDPEGNSHENGGSNNRDDEPNSPGNAGTMDDGNTNTMDENSPGSIHTTDDDKISIENGSPEDP